MQPTVSTSTFVPSNVFKNNAIKSLTHNILLPQPTAWSYQPNAQFGTLNQIYPNQTQHPQQQQYNIHSQHNNDALTQFPPANTYAPSAPPVQSSLYTGVPQSIPPSVFNNTQTQPPQSAYVPTQQYTQYISQPVQPHDNYNNAIPTISQSTPPKHYSSNNSTVSNGILNGNTAKNIPPKHKNTHSTSQKAHHVKQPSGLFASTTQSLNSPRSTRTLPNMKSPRSTQPRQQAATAVLSPNNTQPTQSVPTTQSLHGSKNVDEVNDRIKVIVRVRPLQPYELTDAPSAQQQCLQLNTHTNSLVIDYKAQNGSILPKQYNFDKLIDQSVDQTQFQRDLNIYHHIDKAINGYSACVFAYGQTGSGKTFTMSGNSDGINFASADMLFDMIAQYGEKQHSTVRCSYLEIYNEQLRDLLQPPNSNTNLSIRQDTTVSTRLPSFYVTGSVVVTVQNAEDLHVVLREGQRNRQRRSHALNTDSSRSHTVLSIYIDTYDVNEPTVVRHGKYTLVDLCGSENLKTSGNVATDAIRETQHINKSLFCLNNILSALSINKADKLKPSYRDSTLTKLLADSLFGNGYCVMVACLSPSIMHVNESYRTLLYASRARNIKVNAVINVDVKDSIIMDLRKHHTKLSDENAQLRLLLQQHGINTDYVKQSNTSVVPAQVVDSLQQQLLLATQQCTALQAELQQYQTDAEKLQSEYGSSNIWHVIAQVRDSSHHKPTETTFDTDVDTQSIPSDAAAFDALLHNNEHISTAHVDVATAEQLLEQQDAWEQEMEQLDTNQYNDKTGIQVYDVQQVDIQDAGVEQVDENTTELQSIKALAHENTQTNASTLEITNQVVTDKLNDIHTASHPISSIPPLSRAQSSHSVVSRAAQHLTTSVTQQAMHSLLQPTPPVITNNASKPIGKLNIRPELVAKTNRSSIKAGKRMTADNLDGDIEPFTVA